MEMRTGKYVVCVCLAVGLSGLAQAGDRKFGVPKIAVAYDFNAVFSDDHAHGPRIQIFSNNRYFNSRKNQWKPRENALAFAYGLGLGSYNVNSLKQKGSDNDMYHTYAVLQLIYGNGTIFEPFLGVYPGLSWGSKSGFFVNPAAGINITAFHITRNWNSKLLQTFVQFRVEYNNSLSSFFCGGGMVFQFL